MSKLSDEELLRELEQRFIQNKQTVEELKQLTEELKTANKKLEESEALKSHFISNITNEIVNPFTSIMGLAKSILSVKKESWKTVISMVSHIYSEAFNLDFQFRNIFVAAKLESGEVTPEVCNTDIGSLIESLIESFKIETKKKSVSITSNIDNEQERKPFYFKTDPEKLRLIIANLLSNAIKFSYEEGFIDIDVNKQENKLIIAVTDKGEGISAANLKTIFDRFKRGDSGISSVRRGHGLGLSVTKALLDMLNGEIDVETKPEKGSKFIITVPEAETEITGMAMDDNEIFFDEDQGDDEVF